MHEKGLSKSNHLYCKIYTIDRIGSVTEGGKAQIIEGNFDRFVAVGDVRVDRNSLPNTSPEEWYFRSLFVFDFQWARKWDQVLYNGKTDGLKTGIFLEVEGSCDTALIIDDEMSTCLYVEVGKKLTIEREALTRIYEFDGESLSIRTTY